MKKISGIAVLANKMLLDMSNRFKFIVDTGFEYFDPVYVASTLLNPPYRGILSQEQTDAARVYILNLTTHESAHDQSQSAAQSAHTMDIVGDESAALVEPQPKRFKHLSRVSSLLDQSEKEIVTVQSQVIELNDYLQAKVSEVDLQLDPLVYWINRLSRFPSLAKIACDLLAVPASTAPVERIFSTSGEATTGRRNRLTDENLEREVFLRQNKMYL